MTKNMKIGNILISREEINKKVKELGALISNDYKGEEIIAVGILKGCFVFMSDIIREITTDVQTYFMQVSSYGSGTESSGEIHIKKDIDVDICGKDVIIFEDIIDSGNTLSVLVPMLKERGPNSVKVCTLLSKPSRRMVEFEADYTGFEIPDKFIIGYGLDCDEKFRQLPYIAEVVIDDDI